MLELYHGGLTTCSKQVRHCLREKGLPYKSHFVELWRYENLSPDYLKLNPNGVVPTLVHDGVPIINSFCINEYIEDAFPDPPLRPKDLHERARMRYWAWTADEVHPALARLSYAHMMQRKIRELSEADLNFMLSQTPVPERRERWRVLAKVGHSAEQLDEALTSVLFTLGRMDQELAARGPWVAGATFSLGDISMGAIVHRTFELYPQRLDRGASRRQAGLYLQPGRDAGATREANRCRHQRVSGLIATPQSVARLHRVNDNLSKRRDFFRSRARRATLRHHDATKSQHLFGICAPITQRLNERLAVEPAN
jgi:glutathione S-transferase